MKKSGLLILTIGWLPVLSCYGLYGKIKKYHQRRNKEVTGDNSSKIKTETYISILCGTIATFLGAKEVLSFQDRIIKSFEANEQNKVKFINERDRVIETMESNENKIHIYDCVAITKDFLYVMRFKDIYERFDSEIDNLSEDNEEVKSQQLYKWICTLQENSSKK